MPRVSEGLTVASARDVPPWPILTRIARLRLGAENSSGWADVWCDVISDCCVITGSTWYRFMLYLVPCVLGALCTWCLVMVHSILIWLCIMIHIMLWLALYYDTCCIAMVMYYDTYGFAMFMHYDVYYMLCVWFLLLGFDSQVLCCLYLRLGISMDVIQSWVRRVKARCVHVWSRLAVEANDLWTESCKLLSTCFYK